MHIASYKKNKNNTIKYTQQKWYPVVKAHFNAIWKSWYLLKIAHGEYSI